EEAEAQVPAQGDDVQEPAAEEFILMLFHPPLLYHYHYLLVEGLENDKAAQQLEIVNPKARVKKLEKINKGRIIVDMDQDEGTELVTAQEKDAEVEGMQADKQAEIYNIDLDHSSKVLSMQEDDTE
nr:hypothetical protein [Tanacetum cinerariifolium]